MNGPSDAAIEAAAIATHQSDEQNLSWEEESGGYHDIMRYEAKIALTAALPVVYKELIQKLQTEIARGNPATYHGLIDALSIIEEEIE